MLRSFVRSGIGCFLAAAAFGASAPGAELKLLLPLNGTAYQTNEAIDLSIIRSDKAALAAGDLTLTLSGRRGASWRSPSRFRPWRYRMVRRWPPRTCTSTPPCSVPAITP
ncbi:MAG TPA: hypothetical protein VIL86_13300 [Tepidisphaeraceae bacterium]|jgi:hypothetical protein